MTQPDSPLRVAIWTAVSSKAQAAADKVSLTAQEASGREFAASLHAHVVRVYSIPGHTRDLIFWQDAESSMDAYRQLRLDCESHTFDVLYALDVDRLGRDPALSNQVISLVEKSGAEVYLDSAPHTVGQSSIAQRYIHAIQSVRAKEDQVLRVRRMSAGLRARVLDRGLPANHWPIGYTPIPGPNGAAHTAELDPTTAPAVQLATEMFIAGETYANIMHALNTSPYHPMRAARWAYGTVYRILNNDHYAGYPHWGDTIPAEPSTAYPLIWPPDTHAAIIRERARRANRRYDRTDGSPYAGIVQCARCGGPMTRNPHPNRRTYSLRCSTHSRQSITGVPCHPNSIPESRITAALDQFLHHLATLDLTVLLDQTDHTAPLRRDLDKIKAQLHELSKQRRRLALALAAGKLDPQMYRTTDDQLLDQANAIQTQIENTHALIAAAPDNQARRSALLLLTEQFSELYTGPPHRLRTLLQNTGVHITVDAGTITAIEIR